MSPSTPQNLPSTESNIVNSEKCIVCQIKDLFIFCVVWTCDGFNLDNLTTSSTFGFIYVFFVTPPLETLRITSIKGIPQIMYVIKTQNIPRGAKVIYESICVVHPTKK